MLNRPTESELAQLCEIPVAENTPLEERVIHMHFFLDNSAWYMAGYDPRRQVFYGYVIPDNDYTRARWDRFSLLELDRFRQGAENEVVRNLDWKPKRAMEVDRIREAYELTKRSDTD